MYADIVVQGRSPVREVAWRRVPRHHYITFVDSVKSHHDFVNKFVMLPQWFLNACSAVIMLSYTQDTAFGTQQP